MRSVLTPVRYDVNSSDPIIQEYLQKIQNKILHHWRAEPKRVMTAHNSHSNGKVLCSLSGTDQILKIIFRQVTVSDY